MMTVTSCGRAPWGKNAPAIWLLVTTVAAAVLVEIVCSTQSLQLWSGVSAPCSMRNLIGSVRPLTSWKLPLVCVVFPASVATTSTSAKPRM